MQRLPLLREPPPPLMTMTSCLLADRCSTGLEHMQVHMRGKPENVCWEAIITPEVWCNKNTLCEHTVLHNASPVATDQASKKRAQGLYHFHLLTKRRPLPLHQHLVQTLLPESPAQRM